MLADMTNDWASLSIISTPSIAAMMESGGVIKLSANRSDTEMIVSAEMADCASAEEELTLALSTDTSAKIPPSPSLSTIMMNWMYLMLTISVRVQKINEATPSTATSPRGQPGRMDGFVHGIHRTGADIAENDTDRCEGHSHGGRRFSVLLVHTSRPTRTDLII